MSEKVSREKLARLIKERPDLFPITNKKKLTLENLLEILDGVPVLIQEFLAKEVNVHWKGLGVFQVIHRKERKTTNPRTRELMTIPSKKSVKIKPSTSLRNCVS